MEAGNAACCRDKRVEAAGVVHGWCAGALSVHQTLQIRVEVCTGDVSRENLVVLWTQVMILGVLEPPIHDVTGG